MKLILNKYAGAGTAVRLWRKIENEIYRRFNKIDLIELQSSDLLKNVIISSVDENDFNFIIAGGDGTVNLFINNLIEVLNEEQIKKIKIGVIGIGSSNDFCKPFDLQSTIEKIPCRINFSRALPRDVGVIKYRSGTQFLHKYFLLNASIGVTAQANDYFNKPDKFLSFLKVHFKAFAIIYAALRTILTYKNCEVQIIVNPDEAYCFPVSNLSIVKSPNISGNLSYPIEADYQNGLFDIFLAHSMNSIELIGLLKFLSKNSFPKNNKTVHSKSSKIKLKASEKFLIEFDGEIISTNYAEFSILSKFINICTN